MKIYFKSRTAQRAYKGKGKKLDLGTSAAKRWAVDIKQ